MWVHFWGQRLSVDSSKDLKDPIHSWPKKWVGIEHQIVSLLLLVLFYMENYSFLVLCNASERTTGKWLKVWQVAQKQLQLGLWELLPWISSEPGQFSAKHSPEHEMSSGCSAEQGEAQGGGRGMQPLLPWTGGAHRAGGSSSFTGWLLFHSLCVHPWGTHGSRTSLSPVVPRPMHWPVTLDFLWHSEHKYCTYSSKPCSQKKPNKVKPCS